MRFGVRVTGGSFPAQVWHDYMLPALAAVPAQDWERPPEQLQYNVLPPPPTTTPPTTAPKKHRGGNGNGRGGGGNGRGGGGNR